MNLTPHIEYLSDRLSKCDRYPWRHLPISYHLVAEWLCGVNYTLADNPFSKEFLANVAYNSSESMIGVLYLQMCHLAETNS